MGRRKKNLINGKLWAYTAITRAPGKFIVAICGEGEGGYRPLPEDSDCGGDYESELAAERTAKKLNDRLGLTEAEIRRIVLSTMPRTRRVV